MTIYISMLRGINVGGHNQIKMPALRELFESLGFEQVRTYIQSGNVVFKAGKGSSLQVSKKVEERIAREFGIRASVVTRTSAEMGSVIESNPFLKANGVDLTKLHVTFLSKAPEPAALKQLEPLAVEPDKFRCCDREIYLYALTGMATQSCRTTRLRKY